MIFMTIEEVIAHVEIRDVLARYIRGGDRMDPELVRGVYWPDAQIKHGHTKDGVKVIERANEHYKKHSLPAAACHHITTQYIKLDDADHARVESYYFALWPYYDKDQAAHTGVMSGRYLDKFERRNGEWRIKERLVVQDFNRAEFLGEQWTTMSEFPRGTSTEDDPSFEFFA
ncbi:MAG: nuclear transport factor 2 family protein [Dialister sp.]|nr:nuclear transport factor 2 family protein [Dialister sp.]